MASYNDGVCEYLETFNNIRCTPAWYFKKWPGFLNAESYKILAVWDKGVRTEEEWLREQGVDEEKGEQEQQELQFMLETETEPDIEMQNKKRTQNSVYLEAGFEQTPP